jgi:hypothetical protein
MTHNNVKTSWCLNKNHKWPNQQGGNVLQQAYLMHNTPLNWFKLLKPNASTLMDGKPINIAYVNESCV